MALGDGQLLDKICEFARERRQRCPLRDLLKECRLTLQDKISECDLTSTL